MGYSRPPPWRGYSSRVEAPAPARASATGGDSGSGRDLPGPRIRTRGPRPHLVAQASCLQVRGNV
eukprot:5677538-Pyramimonas_sp.AAC.1